MCVNQGDIKDEAWELFAVGCNGCVKCGFVDVVKIFAVEVVEIIVFAVGNDYKAGDADVC